MKTKPAKPNRTKKRVVKLDLERMVRAIDVLVNNDLGCEVTSKTGEKPTWTQEESAWMADTIGKIYLIAHSIHCKACQGNFILPPKRLK